MSQEFDPPIPATIDHDGKMIPGFVMKLTPTGVMVEIEKIPFKVGSYVKIAFTLDENFSLLERVRSIKHYKQFYRKAFRKPGPGEQAPPAKELCELHFQYLNEEKRNAIMRFLKIRAIKQSMA